jgi:hypothetical protein
LLVEGYAKSIPLKDGTPYFTWNIEKIRPLIAKDHQPLSTVEYWVNEVRSILKDAEALLITGMIKLVLLFMSLLMIMFQKHQGRSKKNN